MVVAPGNCNGTRSSSAIPDTGLDSSVGALAPLAGFPLAPASSPAEGISFSIPIEQHPKLLMFDSSSFKRVISTGTSSQPVSSGSAPSSVGELTGNSMWHSLVLFSAT